MVHDNGTPSVSVPYILRIHLTFHIMVKLPPPSNGSPGTMSFTPEIGRSSRSGSFNDLCDNLHEK